MALRHYLSDLCGDRWTDLTGNPISITQYYTLTLWSLLAARDT